MSELEPPRRSRLMTWAILGIAAGIAGVLLWIFLAPPSTARYGPLIRAAENRTLPPDVKGTIDLSKSFPGITVNNLMYLRRWPQGRFAAFFPTYLAAGPVTAGLMYVSAPLQSEDLTRRDTLMHFDKPIIGISSWAHLRIDSKLNEHWYRVSYGLE